jgi:hypothetical protein
MIDNFRKDTSKRKMKIEKMQKKTEIIQKDSGNFKLVNYLEEK